MEYMTALLSVTETDSGSVVTLVGLMADYSGDTTALWKGSSRDLESARMLAAEMGPMKES